MKTYHHLSLICTVLVIFSPLKEVMAEISPGYALENTYWIAVTGDNANPCSETQPCQTINHVLDNLASDGDIIKILPGIYREQLDISQSDLLLEGTGAGVYIYSSAMPELVSAEGKYVADWSWGTSFQGTTFCSNLTSDLNLDTRHCNTLGFWENGENLSQVFSKADVVDGTFYYDEANEEVWLLPYGDGIESIEGLAHPYAVKLTATSRNVTLKNLNIWYGASMPDDGVLQIEGAGHSLVDIDVRYSSGAGILVFGADQVAAENVSASHHGQNGWRIRAAASFSTSNGWEIDDWVDDLTLTQSVSQYNGWKGFDNCWGGGGTKFSFTNNLIIDEFYSSDNNGFGIWLDIENHEYEIKGSMSARDTGRGIFVEYISDNGTVENNVVFATEDGDHIGCGVSVGLAAADSRNVTIRNNTVYAPADDVKGMMLKTGCETCRFFPYASEDITWDSNLLVNKSSAGFVRDLDAGTADSFVYTNTSIEEQFPGDASVLACWDALPACSISDLDILVLEAGTYLADEASECGYGVLDTASGAAGAVNFVHPRSEEICGSPPIPEPPSASFDFQVDGFEVTFTDTSEDDGGIASWAWDFGDGTTSTDQHPVHTYAGAGTYTVILTITDADALTDFNSVDIVVEEIVAASPPEAGFEFEANELSVSFFDTSLDDGEVVSWTWDFGDGNSSVQQNPVHEYVEPGTYFVTLTVQDNEELIDDFSMDVEVVTTPDLQPPDAAFAYEIVSDSVVFMDLSVDEDGVVEQWEWHFGDGQDSSEQHPVHRYESAGAYLVTLNVVDNDGLADSTCLWIEIQSGEEQEGAFIEEGGMVVMEAEHFLSREENLETGDAWFVVGTDSSILLAVQALEDDGDFIQTDYMSDNATLAYPVQFENAGTYYIWLRLWALEDGSTVYAGIEDQAMRMGVMSNVVPAAEWAWYGMKNEGREAQFTIAETGEKMFKIWMREDGISVDRIVLTTDEHFVPEDIGPDESPRLEISANADPGNKRERGPGESLSLPVALKVSGYPNPAIHVYHIVLDLPEPAVVDVEVYNILGQKLWGSGQKRLPQGAGQRMPLDPEMLPAGTYSARVRLLMGDSEVILNELFTVLK